MPYDCYITIFAPSNFLYYEALENLAILENYTQQLLYTEVRFDSPTRAKTLLLDQLISADSFGQLKIDKKLGYLVLEPKANILRVRRGVD